MPKRRENRAIGFIVSTIRSIAKTCSYTGGIAAVQMVVAPAWTDKVLSRSKRGGSKGGWGNWRRKSRRIAIPPSGAWAARSHGDLLPSERWSFASPFSFTSVPLCLPENSLEFAQERDSIDLGVTIGEGPKNRGEGIEHRLPSPDRFAHGARIFVASS